MSRSAVYCVLIRDGKKRWFAEVWGSLRRELIWGPEAFEAWLAAGEEVDWEPEDVSGAAIVDFDAKTLAWGEQEVVTPPRALTLYRQILQNAWPGFAIKQLPSTELSTPLYALLDSGEQPMSEDEDDEDEAWEERPSTVAEAAEYFYPQEDDEEEEDDEESEQPFSEDCPGAWLTIVDQNGKLRQRRLSAVSVDLLSGEKSAVQAVAKLGPLELPAEKHVTEGLWIEIGQRKIGYWGSEGEAIVERLRNGWSGWTVELAESGYAQQCQISELPGTPMSDAEALGQLLPALLSNKRMSMANLIGAVGGSLKKTAIKATGCLTLILSLPIVLTGFFMDRWKEAGYAIIALVVIVAGLFKFFEYRLKAKFKNSGLAEMDDSLDEQRPAVAGPLDEETRKHRVDAMLAACSLPALAEIEPHFDDDLSDLL